MSTFESSIREIPYAQTVVYNMLSNLSNLEKIKDKIPADKLEQFSFDADSICIKANPVGEIKLRIIDREEPKCIKFEAEQSPVPFNFWIQLLPVTATSSKMKLTIKAELNPFIKGMVKKPLTEGIEKLADLLQYIQYE
ncbi:MAG: SRPBCC family protein [Prevotella sp.]|nr:SRPBCC family protein [Prevotella sp.]MDD7461716.1 SRPBCC family protein [Prevotellaceae bacterium]MDY3365273.1 SRPBCC family protein [Prevotella sp.]MDY3852979.1 SRPBCC family protein [Prevotella sp.]